jgi:hypothetical protein
MAVDILFFVALYCLPLGLRLLSAFFVSSNFSYIHDLEGKFKFSWYGRHKEFCFPGSTT